jgi:hypothetical protein
MSAAPERSLPPALAEAIRRDLHPVRPLMPPSARAAIIIVLAAVAAVALLVTHGLREDMDTIPAPVFWIPFILRLGAGAILVAFAAREAVPSLGPARPARIAAFAGALALLVILPEAFARAVGVPRMSPRSIDLVCYEIEMAVAAPAFLLACWLVMRGYAVRPLFAMTAAGIGVGLLADAALFAACPIDNSTHWMLAHSGAVVTYAVFGAMAGFVIQRLRGAR